MKRFFFFNLPSQISNLLIVRMEFIDLKTPYKIYQKKIDEAVKNVLSSGQYIMGQPIQELEEALADCVGSKHCIATSSGTDSLLLAMTALGIGPGDEVITVPYTWVSPVEVIRRVGARPVFVDVEPETCLMDPEHLENVITLKTKAILPISLYGQMPNFERINQIARSHGIPVIEDAAQSFGASQFTLKSCNASLIGTTSFFPTKSFGCAGDGGAVFTNDSTIAEKIKSLRVHGAPQRYNHQYIGMNARMDTLQAALLLAKLPFFGAEIAARNKAANYYNENLKDDFQLLSTSAGNTSVYPLYVLRSPNRDENLKILEQHQIPFALYYPVCIHQQPAYQDLDYKDGDFPVAEKIASEVFSIPMHPWLTQAEQDAVIEALKASILQVV